MKKFTLEFKKAVVDEYNTERYTMAQVAKRFGVSESVVYKWVHLDRAGELGVVKERVKRGSSFDTERMVELYRDGVGIRSIAAEVGCSASAVKCHLLSADVYEGSERGTSRKIKLTEDVRKKILDDYNSKIISMQELSSKYDVTASSIRRVLRDFGIMNPFGKGKGVHKSSLKYTLSDSVISDYETGLYTHKNLSRKYGVSTRTISIILSAAGLKAIGMIPHTPSHVVAQLRGGVLAVLAEGNTVYEVAELHKIPVDTVERIAGGGKESEDSVTETPVGMGDGIEDKVVSLHEGGRKMT
ncbi:MAG: transposase, partial [Spirochaetaceae bacterium]|nr:transposase [Spirochaetaceae bacterium]